MSVRACEPAPPRRWTCGLLAASLALALVYSIAFQESVRAADTWEYEILHDKRGKTFKGLVLRETPTDIRFQCVIRRPGERTILFDTTFQRDEVERVERLSASERELLAARLHAIAWSARDEKERMEKIELKPAPWGKRTDGGLSYASEYFVLVSNARPELVRRAAVRLEQIYAAYTRYLPPRRQVARPTTILLVRSLAEYHARQREQGREFQNPAYYEAPRNQIVWGSDFQRLADDYERVRKQHAHLRDRLWRQEVELQEQYKGKVPRDLLKPILMARSQIEGREVSNERTYVRASERLFRILQHEAFHAYLANHVFAAEEAEIPHWLNEGLAQIFETALVEAGELRIEQTDAERLARVRTALARGEMVSVADLLSAGPRPFLVAHASDQQISDRYYLASWALAFYLAFDRNKLNTSELERYVEACQRSGDPVKAFRDWVGQPLESFEKGFHQYLLHLRGIGR